MFCHMLYHMYCLMDFNEELMLKGSSVSRILIVEDDSALSSGVSIGLRSEATEIEQAKSLREAREKIRTYCPGRHSFSLPDTDGTKKNQRRISTPRSADAPRATRGKHRRYAK